MRLILKSKYYKKYVLNNKNFKTYWMIDKIILLLFKHNFYLTLYIIGKIK